MKNLKKYQKYLIHSGIILSSLSLIYIAWKVYTPTPQAIDANRVPASGSFTYAPNTRISYRELSERIDDKFDKIDNISVDKINRKSVAKYGWWIYFEGYIGESIGEEIQTYFRCSGSIKYYRPIFSHYGPRLHLENCVVMRTAKKSSQSGQTIYFNRNGTAYAFSIYDWEVVIDLPVPDIREL